MLSQSTEKLLRVSGRSWEGRQEDEFVLHMYFVFFFPCLFANRAFLQAKPLFHLASKFLKELVSHQGSRELSINLSTFQRPALRAQSSKCFKDLQILSSFIFSTIFKDSGSTYLKIGLDYLIIVVVITLLCNSKLEDQISDFS